MKFDPLKAASRIVSRTRAEAGIVSKKGKSPAEKLEAQGWEVWLKTIFPKYFSKPFGDHHRKFWDKVWAITPDEAPEPDLEPWSRDFGKSMSIEAAGAMLLARKIRKYILYFSGTQKQSDAHVLNMNRMILSSRMAEYYPEFAQVQKSEETGANVSWNRTRLVAGNGAVVDSLGLESAVRGARLDELRPDLIFIDDIDDIDDSMETVEKKIAILAADIFPTAQDNTWIVFVQNVIHADSVMQQVMDGRAGILLNHAKPEIVKALKSYSHETFRGANGLEQFRITQCEPSWPEGFGKERAEKELNNSGYLFFEREYQHNTKLAVPGSLYPGYSEIHHIVTWSELAAEFERLGVPFHDEDGNLILPRPWPKGLGHDFGTTPDHPTGLKWLTRPGELQPYSDMWIWYRERCLPKWPMKKGELAKPVSPVIICKLIRELEDEWDEDEAMEFRVMSHEQSSAQGTYRDLPDEMPDDWEFKELEGLEFKKRKGDMVSGIDKMQDRFVLDLTRPHPFRFYPQGYKEFRDGQWVDLSGQRLMGRPRQVHVVADGQGELYVGPDGELLVRQAVNDDGMIRSRAERRKYRNARTAEGRETNKPHALFNDLMDTERYAAEEASNLWLAADKEVKEQYELEKRIQKNYPHLTTAALAAREPEQRQGAQFARQMAERRVRQDMNAGNLNGSPLIKHKYGRRGR